MARRQLPALRSRYRNFAGPARDAGLRPPFDVQDANEYLQEQSYRRYGKGCSGDQAPHGDCQQAHGINTFDKVSLLLQELSKGKGRRAKVAQECARGFDAAGTENEEALSEACANLVVKLAPTATYLAAQEMEEQGYDMGIKRGTASVDWRPQETIPEDYSGIVWLGGLITAGLLARAIYNKSRTSA